MIEDKSLSTVPQVIPIANPDVKPLAQTSAKFDRVNRIKILCSQCRSEITGKANAVMLICPVCGKTNAIIKPR